MSRTPTRQHGTSHRRGLLVSHRVSLPAFDLIDTTTEFALPSSVHFCLVDLGGSVVEDTQHPVGNLRDLFRRQSVNGGHHLVNVRCHVVECRTTG